MKKKEKYTAKQIAECKHYLHYCVKMGALDIDEAQEIVRNEDWDYVYEMMFRADAHADAQRKGEL